MSVLYNLDSSAQRFVDEWNNREPYIVAHTSGSTGKPKTINLLKSDMIVSAEATCTFFNLTTESWMLCPLSCEYIAGKMMYVRSLVAKNYLIFEPPSNHPISLDSRSLLGDAAIDLLPIVPSQALSIIDNIHILPEITNVIIGGAPLSPDIEKRLMQLPINAFATYGMTETCSHVALRKLGLDSYRALPHVTFDTTADNRLIVNSASSSWSHLVTNDVVRLISDTEFLWLGRADSVINSGGVKLHPEAIEKELSPFIDSAFYVRGIPDSKLGTALQLVIEDCDGTADTRAIMDAISSAPDIHPYHKPRSVVTVPRIRRTPNGKVKRT